MARRGLSSHADTGWGSACNSHTILISRGALGKTTAQSENHTARLQHRLTCRRPSAAPVEGPRRLTI